MSGHSTPTSGTQVPEAAYEMWRRALSEPSLRDLPFKVETNEYGQLVMSPHKPQHSLFQSEILRNLLFGSAGGRAATEFAVETASGIKVPDVIWISDERLSQLPGGAAASPIMPELVVEVLSKGNTAAEIDEKRRLYFDGGAVEFWTCAADGKITFYTGDGPAEASTLFSGFPNRVD